jgi:hypothetical protein
MSVHKPPGHSEFLPCCASAKPLARLSRFRSSLDWTQERAGHVCAGATLLSERRHCTRCGHGVRLSERGYRNKTQIQHSMVAGCGLWWANTASLLTCSWSTGGISTRPNGGLAFVFARGNNRRCGRRRACTVVSSGLSVARVRYRHCCGYGYPASVRSCAPAPTAAKPNLLMGFTIVGTRWRHRRW